jgi:hypothetical protein
MNVISKKDAKTQGLKRYFTGKPCKFGHIEARYIGNGKCIACPNRWRKNRPIKWPTGKKAHVDYVTREEARMSSLLRYFTGIPCKNKHITERYTAGGMCLGCLAFNSSANKSRYRKTQNLNKVKRRTEDPTYRERINAQKRIRNAHAKMRAPT